MPTPPCCAESWTMGKEDVNKITATEMRFIRIVKRWSLSLDEHIRYAWQMRIELDMSSLFENVDEHVHHMEMDYIPTVSYTHLDVYKRQQLNSS